jgi:hypothetical protein
MAIQIDAGLNFFLWLMGKDHNPTSFISRYLSKRPHSIKIAPLPEMWAYIRKEYTEARRLQLEEYSLSFLSWVSRYLNQDPTVVLASGISLARTAADKLLSKIHKRSTEVSMSSSAISQKRIAGLSRLDGEESEGNPRKHHKPESKREAYMARHQGVRPMALSSNPPMPPQKTSSSSSLAQCPYDHPESSRSSSPIAR